MGSLYRHTNLHTSSQRFGVTYESETQTQGPTVSKGGTSKRQSFCVSPIPLRILANSAKCRGMTERTRETRLAEMFQRVVEKQLPMPAGNLSSSTSIAFNFDIVFQYSRDAPENAPIIPKTTAPIKTLRMKLPTNSITRSLITKTDLKIWRRFFENFKGK